MLLDTVVPSINVQLIDREPDHEELDLITNEGNENSAWLEEAPESEHVGV
jgi:hypothetical protein